MSEQFQNSVECETYRLQFYSNNKFDNYLPQIEKHIPLYVDNVPSLFGQANA